MSKEDGRNRSEGEMQRKGKRGNLKGGEGRDGRVEWERERGKGNAQVAWR